VRMENPNGLSSERTRGDSGFERALRAKYALSGGRTKVHGELVTPRRQEEARSGFCSEDDVRAAT